MPESNKIEVGPTCKKRAVNAWWCGDAWKKPAADLRGWSTRTALPHHSSLYRVGTSPVGSEVAECVLTDGRRDYQCSIGWQDSRDAESRSMMLLRGPFRPLSRRLQHLQTRQASANPDNNSTVQRIQDQQLRNINPESLSATLDAHRLSNKIRRVGSPRSPQDAARKIDVEYGIGDIQKSPVKETEIPQQSTRVPILHQRPLRKSPNDSSLHYGEAMPVLPECRVRHTVPEHLPVRLWDKGIVDRWGDRRQALDQDMIAYASWVNLTPDEVNMRRRLALHIQNVLQPQFSDLSFHHFGSLDSGMATPSSDIDLGFSISSLARPEGERGPSYFRPKVQTKIRDLVTTMSDFLCKIQGMTNVDCTLSSKMPLVRATFSGPLIGLDIVSSGVNPPRQDAHVKNYCAEFPQLKPLYFVVKAVLTIRDLFEPSRGGMGSYRLVVLIVAFLKLRPRSSRESLTTTLVDFLSWTADLNTSLYGVAADPPRLFKKHSADTILSLQAKDAISADMDLFQNYQIGLINEQRPYALILQDPADFSVDVGKSCYRIMDIRATFRSLADKLSRWVEHDETLGKLAGEDAMIEYLLGSLPVEEDRRRKIASWWAAKHQDKLPSL